MYQKADVDLDEGYQVPNKGSIFKRHKYVFLGLLILVILVIIIAVVGSRKSDDPTPAPPLPVWETLRLPDYIVPQEYHLEVWPDLNQFTFNGTITANYTLTEATSVLVIHALGLNVSVVSNLGPGGVGIEPATTFFYAANEFFVIQFNEALQVGGNVLTLQFSGPLTNSLAGFYLSTYQINGVTKYLATTHFEPTDARRAFPCWDEPAKKAKFTISITCDSALTPISNMPVSLVTPISTGLQRVDFQTSVKMSTYLVAFVVSDFGYVEGQTTDMGYGTKLVRVWAQKDKLAQAETALAACIDILAFYEEYFQVGYPLPKQDMIAIPDFAAGAMENWGLITYRETALLYNPLTDSASNLQRVVVVVAHELAHQWFGNLVTMDWWNELWLNEGFASYMEFRGANHFRPDFGMDEQFVRLTLHGALQLDSTEASHPLLGDVADPAEINEIFDSISYDKGASMIYMLVDWLGESDFLKGIHNYLTTLAYGNAKSSELWSALANASTDSVDVNTIMNAWTLKKGYPLLTVSPLTGTQYAVSQQHFVLNVSQQTDTQWFVRVTATAENWNKNIELILIPGEGDGALTYDAPVDGWLKLNLNSTAYARVAYPLDNYNRLATALLSAGKAGTLSTFKLTSPDRQSLIDDAGALVQANINPVWTALNMTKFLEYESYLSVWQSGLSLLNDYKTRISGQPYYFLFAKYMTTLLTPIYTKLGWNSTGDTHPNILLRNSVLSNSVVYGVGDAVTYAQTLFNAFMANPDGAPVPGDYSTFVYNLGVQEGGQAAWEFMFARYKNSSLSAAEIVRCMGALSRSKDPIQLNRTLAAVLNPADVRSQDALSLLSQVATNTFGGREMAWNFLTSRWDELFAMFGGASFNFGNAIYAVVAGFADEMSYQEVITFFQGKEIGSGYNKLAEGLEAIRLNIKWLEDNSNDFQLWLDLQ